ncbi:MAG: N-acetylglutamate synthase, partial [Betaproteobacteria bacterium]|nr:N-acetylglutamate synthase [Betaproteobacteria bacterium]
MSNDPLPSLPNSSVGHGFVSWLRSVAPYIHAFRNQTFVIAFPGELVAEGRLESLVHDVALLQAMG